MVVRANVKGRTSRRRRTVPRRGSVLIYSLFLMVILFALTSLAVDYGHAQLTKLEMQRNADFTARGTLQTYANSGSASATAVAASMSGTTHNPVDGNSAVQPTVAVIWGYWNAGTKTFVAGSGSPLAVKVTVFRTAAGGNAVPLTFPLINGFTEVRTTCDVSATAIAVLRPAATTTQTVQATSDLWLSGMPAGSTASKDDTTSNAPSTFALNVAPGSVLSFSASGLTNYQSGSTTIGPDGSSGIITHNEWLNDGEAGLQNGIQTLTGPQNAFAGVFLTNSAPNTVTPPAAGRDYTTAASRNLVSYSDLAVQQPFYIGNGTTSGGNTQSFRVPTGATRLYLGIFDAYSNNDDPGSITVTTTTQAQVYLVK